MDPSHPYFSITQKEKKKGKKKKKKIQAQVFPVNFAGFLRTPFLRTSPVAASEYEHDETKLLYITSRLDKCYIWMICYELFRPPVKIDKKLHFYVAGQKLKWGKTKGKISFLYSFEKDNFSLEDGIIAPNVPPQLHHW